jgi:hypothetical protein
MDEEKVETAYHEAGHVVVAHVLELEITGVTVVPGEDRLARRFAGQAYVPVDEGLRYSYDAEGEDDYIERHLVCYLAGMKAVEILTGEEQDFTDGRYDDDRGGVSDCLLSLAPTVSPDDPALDEHDRLWEWAVSEAGRILDSSWPDVRRVAEVLLGRGELTGDEVKELLN